MNLGKTKSPASSRKRTSSCSAGARTKPTPKKLPKLLASSDIREYLREKRNCETHLLAQLREAHDDLKQLLKKMESHWEVEDLVYRFYHHSAKVHYAAELGNEVFDRLLSVVPWGHRECPVFIRRLRARCRRGRTWRRARADIELMLHAHYFLKMAVKYGKKYRRGPNPMPSGYAALMYLYGLR